MKCWVDDHLEVKLSWICVAILTSNGRADVRIRHRMILWTLVLTTAVRKQGLEGYSFVECFWRCTNYTCLIRLWTFSRFSWDCVSLFPWHHGHVERVIILLPTLLHYIMGIWIQSSFRIQTLQVTQRCRFGMETQVSFRLISKLIKECFCCL